MAKQDEKTVNNLCDAILALENRKEARKFFADLLTQREIGEFANRWKVAGMLNANTPYATIERETGMSSTTIARIQKWLTKGMGGYRLVLKRTRPHNTKPSPAKRLG